MTREHGEGAEHGKLVEGLADSIASATEGKLGLVLVLVADELESGRMVVRATARAGQVYSPNGAATIAALHTSLNKHIRAAVDETAQAAGGFSIDADEVDKAIAVGRGGSA